MLIVKDEQVRILNRGMDATKGLNVSVPTNFSRNFPHLSGQLSSDCEEIVALGTWIHEQMNERSLEISAPTVSTIPIPN
jgi:hypothetical protein